MILAACVAAAAAIVSPARQMTFTGSSHYDFGVAMGRTMSDLIAQRFVSW